MIEDPVLECQDCGEVVKRLTRAEEAQVADRPYNFVVYCRRCRPIGGPGRGPGW